MTLNMTTFDAALKELYKGQVVTTMVYKDRPAIALLKKSKDFYGDVYPLPVHYGGSSNFSSDFSTAQGSGNSRQIKFNLTHSEYHATAQIADLVRLASGKDKGAFVRAAKHEIDDAINNVAEKIEEFIFGDGDGAIGTIASISGSTVTMSDPTEVDSIAKGHVLDGATSTAGTSVDGTYTVDTVDRDAGSFTTTAVPANWAVGDTLYHDGDKNNVLQGFGAWLPASAPGATTFFGVDRSVDTVKLGGVRVDGTSEGTIRESLIKAGYRLHREGSRPDLVFLNPMDLGELIDELGSKEIYNRPSNNGKAAQMGFNSVVLQLPQGSVEVVSARHCPKGVSYMVQSDTWELAFIDELVANTTTPNGDMLRARESTNQAEHRRSFYGNLGCKAPGWNARITLPT